MQYESSSVCITYFGDTCKTCLAFVGFQYVSGLEIFWVLLVYAMYEPRGRNGGLVNSSMLLSFGPGGRVVGS